ncbi:MAG: F0F1 ATP synthase subunit beta, partial [Dictyoglomus sp.]
MEGEIIAVNGPVVDVYFPNDVPSVYEALEVHNPIKNKKLILETRILLGEHKIRTIALGPTEGISRGLKVKRTFNPIRIPVSEEILGRVVNVFGEPIDG